jgi:hypothetical protein
MRTNKEKWDFYMAMVDTKTNAFLEGLVKNQIIPITFYVPNISRVEECTITGMLYAHNRHCPSLFKKAKKRTRYDVNRLAGYANSEIPFSSVNVFFSYVQGERKEQKHVSYWGVLTEMGLRHSLDKALELVSELKKKSDFRSTHAKNADYNYDANGYKFLGWQNAWENNVPIEFKDCVRINHTIIEVKHNSKGSENTVSCPICKIYWKYDCSD